MGDKTKEVQDAIRRVFAFMAGVSHNCPFCDTPVTAAELYPHVEPDSYSLYVLPCGHRLGTWSFAPEWITDVTIVKEQAK